MEEFGKAKEGAGTRIDEREALRYLGAKEPDGETLARIGEIARDAESRFAPRFVFREFTVQKTGDGVLLAQAGLVLPGATAAGMLAEAEKAVLLLCTLGLSFDAYLRSLQARNMARAVMLDACGSALTEAGCDQAEKEIGALYPGFYLTDRFSPGYGDLPLTLQSPILAALNGERRLGVYLTEGYLMNPSKSVTAVIGLCKRPQRARIRGCAYCRLAEDCAYRKKGCRCEENI